MILTVFCATMAMAQFVTVPQASQRSEITQTVGLTTIEIVYHRPLVGERPIWGALVPYDQVWRAGANENTTIAFSTDVMVEGQPLAAGTYGLHMVPTQDKWTVIFSSNHTSWGSFSYNQEEDVLRVEVKPSPAPHRETLTYDFADLKADAATVVLEWEKLRVPFKVAVDTHDVVLANIRNELRSIPGFSWQGWSSAATYCLQNDVNLEEALQWADNAIQGEERFETLSTKAQLLAKTDKKAESDELMARALEVATPLQLHNYARGLIAQGDTKGALEIFELNARKNPDTWFVDIGLARGYSAAGDLKKAAEHMRKGAAQAPEAQRAIYEGLAQQLESGKSL
jgi:tetratricopeptide (TPR) repeat protein